MRECWGAIVLQGAQHRVGIDLVAGAGQETAAIIITKIVTERSNRTVQNKNAPAGTQDGISKLDRASLGADIAAVNRQVVTEGAIGDGGSA